MARRIRLLTLLCVMISGIALGQAKSIGTLGNAGYLGLTDLKNFAFYDGDDGTFNNGTGGANNQTTTIWRMGFLLFDVAAVKQYWADSDAGFTGHASIGRPTSGTRTDPNATVMSNTDIFFSGNTSLSANVSWVLDAPSPGNTARCTWTWAFANSGSPLNFRLAWWVDADVYLVTNSYTDDRVGFTNSSSNPIAAIGLGQPNGSGGIDLDSGILLDTDTAPSAIHGVGVAGNPGASYYWSGGGAPYSTIGDPQYQRDATAQSGIAPELNNKVDNDANNDFVSDSDADVGAVMQWDFSIPTGGVKVIRLYLTYGLDTDLAPNTWTSPHAGVSDWLYF